jgi:hypothetical protein
MQLEGKRAKRMMIKKMKHMYHHLKLNLMAEERGLLVAAVVAVGLQKLKRKVVVMRAKRRNKYLMLKRSTLHHMLT